MSDFLDYKYFASLEGTFDRIVFYREKGGLNIYGTGNGCEKLLYLLNQRNISVDGIFASDDFARGQEFCGYKVKPLSQLENDSSAVLLAFGSDLPEIMKRVEKLEENHIVIAPDMALFDNTAFEKEYFLDNFEKAQKAYSLMSDDMSRKTFKNLSAYKITGNPGFLREIFAERQELLSLLRVGQNEIYCDLGAYNGDTVKEFLDLCKGKYRYIYACEPEKKNFQKCVNSCKELENITLINAAAWSEKTLMNFSGGGGRQGSVSKNTGENLVPCVSVDSIFNGRECTYLKMDVEGADFQVLKGAENTINKFSPEIFTALYHHPYDYIDIPLYINEIYGGYDFYMRQSPYYPAWETNLCCCKKC